MTDREFRRAAACAAYSYALEKHDDPGSAAEKAWDLARALMDSEPETVPSGATTAADGDQPTHEPEQACVRVKLDAKDFMDALRKFEREMIEVHWSKNRNVPMPDDPEASVHEDLGVHRAGKTMNADPPSHPRMTKAEAAKLATKIVKAMYGMGYLDDENLAVSLCEIERILLAHFGGGGK